MVQQITKRTKHHTRSAVIIWVVAILLMLGASAYQRLTGPTYPLRGRFTDAGEVHTYRLNRTGITTEDAKITVPAPGPGSKGTIFYKRYKTGDRLARAPMQLEGTELAGFLPKQPVAGKLEYFVVLQTAEGTYQIPEKERGAAVIRFKDPVPLYLLLPHISLMFLSILFGMRTGLAALFAPVGLCRWAWITLAGLTLGGMILGPLAQKAAFGELWTGFPNGYDLTDNKVLIMWIVWLAACLIIGRGRGGIARQRVAVVLAALVMTVVYLIPHSLRGSELDYSRLDEGVPASEAITTGRK